MDLLNLNIDSLLDRLIAASANGEDFCLLESGAEGNEVVLGIGSSSSFVLNSTDAQSFADFQSWLDQHPHAMGWLGYDLKNRIEKLESKNDDPLKFPEISFFSPAELIKAKGKINWEGFTSLPDERENAKYSQNEDDSSFDIRPLISKQEYLQNVRKIKQHIQSGDVYELNYCQAFIGSKPKFDLLTTYARLSKQTQAPMSGMMSVGGHQILSGSPERFIRKQDQTIISQPIKGTRPRGETPEKDKTLKHQLANSAKDKSENVMIADLVRNDLSKIASPRSVKADELFAIYSFPTVHQMISTISAQVKDDISFTDILRATFPMGSMTGAPKISAMKLIEQFENFKRGPYSGALGYLDSNGNFDFNVLIRSIFHNANNNVIATFAGGAITAESDPEEEYAECMLKAKSMFTALK